MDDERKGQVLKKLEALEKLEGNMNAQAATMIAQIVKVQSELGEVKQLLGGLDAETLKAARANREKEREKEREQQRIEQQVAEAMAAMPTALVATIEPEYVIAHQTPKIILVSPPKDQPTRLVNESTHPFQCPQCRARFPHYAHLAHHISYLHNNRNSLHTCNDCKATFAHELALQEHRRVHAHAASTQTEQPQALEFKCSKCDYSTAYKTNFRAHEFVRHSNSDPAPAPVETL